MCAWTLYTDNFSMCNVLAVIMVAEKLFVLHLALEITYGVEW